MPTRILNVYIETFMEFNHVYRLKRFPPLILSCLPPWSSSPCRNRRQGIYSEDRGGCEELPWSGSSLWVHWQSYPPDDLRSFLATSIGRRCTILGGSKCYYFHYVSCSCHRWVEIHGWLCICFSFLYFLFTKPIKLVFCIGDVTKILF